MEAEALEPEMEMVNNLGRYSKSNYAAPPLPRPATSTIVNRKIFAANSAADSLIAYWFCSSLRRARISAAQWSSRRALAAELS